MTFGSLMTRYGETLANRDGGWCCHYCNATLNRTTDSRDRNQATIDHILPTSRGGENVIENLVLACRWCNGSKNNSTVEEWERRKLQVGIPTLYKVKEGSVALFNGDDLVSREEALGIIKSLMRFYNLL